MASYTTNLNLKKPAQSDKIRIADINGNMDDVDAAFGAVGSTSVATQLGDIREGLAIVSTGDVHTAISAGQFVYVMNHSTLSDGLYTANSAISANATLSNSNVTAVSGGGMNALNSKFATADAQNMTDLNNVTSTGTYSYDKLSSAMSNAPSTGTYFSGTLRVTYYTANKIMQEFIESGGRVFTRHKWNGTWGSWVELKTV